MIQGVRQAPCRTTQNSYLNLVWIINWLALALVTASYSFVGA